MWVCGENCIFLFSSYSLMLHLVHWTSFLQGMQWVLCGWSEVGGHVCLRKMTAVNWSLKVVSAEELLSSAVRKYTQHTWTSRFPWLCWVRLPQAAMLVMARMEWSLAGQHRDTFPHNLSGFIPRGEKTVCNTISEIGLLVEVQQAL